ncbi:SUKH-4 family immunity protein [Salininema proteolyticum]|uniref:SUKH-4 family immunity protein n=1 Tax=Salininema proteolyticum TaxID=1607685 RepID=A0ABV8TW07_9ACTN
MTSRNELLQAWGADNTVEFPAAAWAAETAAPPEAWPDVPLLPAELSVFFTAEARGQFEFGARIALRYEDSDEDQTLIVVGTVTEDPDLLFTVDADTGEVLLINPAEQSMELVNSSLRSFSEFLRELGLFIDADRGGDTRPERALALERRFRDLDPAALEDPESWWSVAVMTMKGELQGLVDYRSAEFWEPGGLIEYPREKLLGLGLPEDTIPAADTLPRRVGEYFSAEVAAPLAPFCMLELSAPGTDMDIRLLVLGFVPDAPDLLYVLDPERGEILHFHRETKEISGVNANLAAFADFLGEIELASRRAGSADLTGDQYEALTDALRDIDPIAFEHPSYWWPRVFPTS